MSVKNDIQPQKKEGFKEEDVPQHCPGPASESAGASSACAGCPNQTICASGAGATGPDPDIAKIEERLRGVKHKILVLSGKGGVGKSTFSAQLAFALAAEGEHVGLLDIDICGPSIPTILGLVGEDIHQSASGWSPVYVDDNLGVMSVGFMLKSQDDAIIWRGPKKNGLIKQFLRDVDWGEELDFMIIDTPPGTSDEHLSITQYLSASGIDGVVLVTTPQDVALLDVRKEINFCRKVKVPILGVVENMSGFVCPKCKTESQIFPPTSGGAAKLCEEFGLSLLGRVPLDPRLARSCDEGVSFAEQFPDTPAAKALADIVKAVKGTLSD